MRHGTGIAAALVVVAMLGCAATERPGSGSDGTWVGASTTEGDVTTVVNESGSVWAGTAELVEELSIGVDTGADPYMLGPISGLAATGDRIYVADDLRFAVRVYDRDGDHLFDFGREGEGPGEFVHIDGLAVDPAGRVFVQGPARVSVFDLDGNLLDTWAYRAASGPRITAAIDGTVYVSASWTEDERRFRGMIAVAADGTEVDRLTGPTYDATPWGLVARGGGRTVGAMVLYAPGAVWAVLPSRAVVRGNSDSYRFTVQRADGGSLVVERAVDLPEVVPEYADWFTAQRTQVMRNRQPDWQWNANPVPVTKPAFSGFAGDRHGRIWVSRALGTATVAGCDADPLSVEGRAAVACWRDLPGLDVFDEDTGRLLGQVSLDEPLRHPVFLEDGILTVREDTAGTIMVKRYRLVMPGER